MLSKTIIIGRLTKDPEVKMTTSGIAVATIGVAVNRNYKNKNGEYDTDFYDAVGYKKTAELLGQYFKKGHMIGIEGKMQSRYYEDKNGSKHKVWELIIENIVFLESKKDNTQSVDKPNVSEKDADDYFDKVNTNIDISEDDLPFNYRL